MTNYEYDHPCTNKSCSTTKTFKFEKVTYKTVTGEQSGWTFPKEFYICVPCFKVFANKLTLKLDPGSHSIKPVAVPVDQITVAEVRRIFREDLTEDQKKKLSTFQQITKRYEEIYQYEHEILQVRYKIRSNQKLLDQLNNQNFVFVKYKNIIEPFIQKNEPIPKIGIIPEEYRSSEFAFNILKQYNRKKSPSQKKFTAIRTQYDLIISALSTETHHAFKMAGFVIRKRKGLKTYFKIHSIVKDLDTFLQMISKCNITISKGLVKKLRRKSNNYQKNSIPMEIIEQSKYKGKYLEYVNLVCKETFIDKGFTMKPFNYQVEDLSKALIKDYTMCTWEMGCGKTMLSSMWSNFKAKGKTIILMPKKNLGDPWQKAIPVFFKGQKVVTILEEKDCCKALGDYDILLVPYSMAFRGLVHKVLKRVKFTKMICDESHNLKSTTAQISKSIRGMANKIPYRLLLTGTPAKKDVNDVFMQMNILVGQGPLLTNQAKELFKYDEYSGETNYENEHIGELFTYSSWKKTFAPASIKVFKGTKLTEMTNKSEYDKLLSSVRIHRYSYEAIQAMSSTYGGEVLKDPITVNKVDVSLSPKEMDFYKRASLEEKKILTRKYARFIERDRMVAGQMTRVYSQILSHPWTYQDNDHSWDFEKDKLSKFEVIITMIDKFMEEGKQVLIGTKHLETFDYYEKKLLERYPDQLYSRRSSFSIKKREEVVDAFKKHNDNLLDNPKGSILLGTIGTMDSGLNIPEVSEVIVESLPWDYASLMQFIYRAIRANSTVSTTAHLIAAKKTFDVNLLSVIASKMKQSKFSAEGTLLTDNEILEGLDASSTYIQEAISYSVEDF